MKQLNYIFIFAALIWSSNQAFAQQGIGTNRPDKSSILELKSENRGLLIPRVELTDLEDSDPIVGTPANSLLVYSSESSSYDADAPMSNTNFPEGYYYWNASLNGGNGAWSAFLTENNLKHKAGDGIYIDEEGNININTQADPSDPNSGNGSVGEGKVLVTVEDSNGNTTTEWIDQNDLLNNIQAGNGLEINKTDPDNPIIELGGPLTHDTTIETNGNNFTIDADGDKFHIDDLNTVTVDAEGNLDGTADAFADNFDVLIVGDDGLVQKVSVADLVRNAVQVKNGLYYDSTDENIKLGGDLTEETTLTLKGNDLKFETNTESGTPDNINISGLEKADKGYKNLVIDGDGNIRTETEADIVKSLVLTKDDNYTLTDGTDDYTYDVEEVLVYAEAAGSADFNITLPADASDADGQTITIKIVNPSNANNGYVGIMEGTTEGPWGYADGRSWVYKSIGGNWVLVADNNY